MQQLFTRSGQLLSYASLAMLMGVQWLHSPLHHLHGHAADHLHGHAADHCEQAEKAEFDEHQHAHHGCHGHHHQHESAETEQPSKSPTPHHHHHDDCELCQFLASKAAITSQVIDLVGCEFIEPGTKYQSIIFSLPRESSPRKRGPPAV